MKARLFGLTCHMARCLRPSACLLALVHPLIHGTPLDMGALDLYIQAALATDNEEAR